MKNQNVQDPILSIEADIAEIKRAICLAKDKGALVTGNEIAMKASSVILFLGISIGLLLIGFEFFSGGIMTANMLVANSDVSIGYLGLAQILMAMPPLVLCVYFVAWRASVHSELDFSSYLANHFKYLANLSFVTDLFVKFVCASAIVIGGHPEWITPLLSLFIGEYLIQGRLFIYPLRYSLSFGIISIVLAFLVLYFHQTSLLWPLIHFAVTTVGSLVYLRARLSELKSTTTSASKSLAG